jgi:hypothetical protein
LTYTATDIENRFWMRGVLENFRKDVLVSENFYCTFTVSPRLSLSAMLMLKGFEVFAECFACPLRGQRGNIDELRNIVSNFILLTAMSAAKKLGKRGIQ